MDCIIAVQCAISLNESGCNVPCNDSSSLRFITGWILCQADEKSLRVEFVDSEVGFCIEKCAAK